MNVKYLIVETILVVYYGTSEVSSVLVSLRAEDIGHGAHAEILEKHRLQKRRNGRVSDVYRTFATFSHMTRRPARADSILAPARGTENGGCASVQSELTRKPNSHRHQESQVYKQMV